MSKATLISADSHVVEPLDVFRPVAKRFGKPEPKMVNTEERGWILDTGLGARIPVGVFATAGMEPQTAVHDATERAGFDARPSLTDIKARLKDMDQDGVDAEVLYPSGMGNFFGTSDFFNVEGEAAEIAKATMASYNDWLADYVGDAAGRMFGLALLQVRDVDAAAAEAERAKKLGHVGAVIPASPDDRPYTDSVYDKLWATLQDLGLPATFHSGVGGARHAAGEAFRRHGLGYTLLHTTAAVTISDIIMGGVCERFPRLKFVVGEFETGWLAHFLKRMDWRQFRREDRSKIRLTFSDYWHRNFLATFEDDEIGIRTRDIIGAGSLMWASDYPHGDSVWPNSRGVVDHILGECSPEERQAFTVRNVVETYHLPFEV